MLGVHLRVGSDEECSLAALVVRRQREGVEEAVAAAGGEAGVYEPVGGGAADEALRARARVDSPRLDADDAADALGRRGSDPDQRRDLLRGEVGDRSAPG